MENFSYSIDADGIATFLFDVPGRTMNTFTNEAIAELDELAETIRSNDAIKGVILASGKSNAFCAGADIGDLSTTAGTVLERDALPAALKTSSRMSAAFRALETTGKPVVAALEGLALGGGFEFALAAHRRVAARPAKVGLPEVKIGLLPGAGGTQRTSRLAGAQEALDLMLSGAPIGAEEALGIGLIDEVVEPGQAIAAARSWLLQGGEGIQPWDRPGATMSDGPYTAAGNLQFAVAAAQIRAKSYGNYPAQEYIARCIYEGFGQPMDRALAVEARLFLATQQTPQARAMIRTNFLSKQALARGDARPQGVPPSKARKAAVLGAGMMGAGIAFVQARAGIETVLVDVAQESADRGKAYSKTIMDKQVAAGAATQADADALLGRIIATTDYDAIADADLVIEAVFEDRGLKGEVTRKAEVRLAPGGIMASNTSTLPISGLAEATQRPENFIGIHFFSPVDRMELVEVIVGKQTSKETLAKALDYCKQLKKVPIVVNDSRGFFTSRVFETYLYEGFEMLMEGVAPAIIDNVGKMCGMPRGPLELSDDVAIDLLDRVAGQRRVDGGLGEPNGGTDRMLADFVKMDRLGRKNGKGFYDYPKGAPKRLWSGLAELFPVTIARSDEALVAHLRQRLLYRQAVETARCLAEGVLTSPRDGDVGAVLGWGFAPWTGGPLSLIDTVGLATFVQQCDELAARYGERFEVPALLRDMSANGQSLYPSVSESRAA